MCVSRSAATGPRAHHHGGERRVVFLMRPAPSAPAARPFRRLRGFRVVAVVAVGVPEGVEHALGLRAPSTTASAGREEGRKISFWRPERARRTRPFPNNRQSSNHEMLHVPKCKQPWRRDAAPIAREPEVGKEVLQIHTAMFSGLGPPATDFVQILVIEPLAQGGQRARSRPGRR